MKNKLIHSSHLSRLPHSFLIFSLQKALVRGLLRDCEPSTTFVSSSNAKMQPPLNLPTDHWYDKTTKNALR